MTETAKLTALAEAAKSALPDAVLDTKLAAGELTLTVARAKVRAVLTFLRDDPAWLFKTLHRYLRRGFPEKEPSASTWSITCSAPQKSPRPREDVHR